MYKVLTEPDGMQQQFADANLTGGQRITIIRMGEFGGINETKAVFKSYENSKYAQYTDTVKMAFRPKDKSKEYYTYLNNNVIIYNGWLDVPENLFWEEDVRTDGSIFMKSQNMHPVTENNMMLSCIILQNMELSRLSIHTSLYFKEVKQNEIYNY